MTPTSSDNLAASAALRLEIVAQTDVGQERELNEDTVWAAPFAAGADNAWQLSGLLVVADGMGGHDAGEVASGLAGQTIRDIFTAPRPPFAPEALTGQGLLAGLSNAVVEVNRAVYAAGETGAASGGRPGTTLTVALLRADEWAIGHVGDSRAYLIRRNGVEQLTNDDSLVAEAVRRGQMTEEEAQSSQFRNQITKAIGLNADVTPSTYQGSWAAGDVILLCSDGLTEYIQPQEMLDAVAGGDSLDSACQSLIDLANRRGGHDNISVAAARFVPNLNGKGAVPINGNGRKPATWPPIERAGIATAADPFVDENPRRKRGAAKPSSKLPWIVAGVVLALGSAAVGLWWGARSANPVVTATKNPVAATPKLEEGDGVGVVSVPVPAPVVKTAPTVIPEVPTVSVWRNDKWDALHISYNAGQLQVKTKKDKEQVGSKRNQFKVIFRSATATKEAVEKDGDVFTCRLGGRDGRIIPTASPSHKKEQLKLTKLQPNVSYSIFLEKSPPPRFADAKSAPVMEFKIIPAKNTSARVGNSTANPR